MTPSAYSVSRVSDKKCNSNHLFFLLQPLRDTFLTHFGIAFQNGVKQRRFFLYSAVVRNYRRRIGAILNFDDGTSAILKFDDFRTIPHDGDFAVDFEKRFEMDPLLFGHHEHAEKKIVYLVDYVKEISENSSKLRHQRKRNLISGNFMIKRCLIHNLKKMSSFPIGE